MQLSEEMLKWAHFVFEPDVPPRSDIGFHDVDPGHLETRGAYMTDSCLDDLLQDLKGQYAPGTCDCSGKKHPFVRFRSTRGAYSDGIHWTKVVVVWSTRCFGGISADTKLTDLLHTVANGMQKKRVASMH